MRKCRYCGAVIDPELHGSRMFCLPPKKCKSKFNNSNAKLERDACKPRDNNLKFISRELIKLLNSGINTISISKLYSIGFREDIFYRRAYTKDPKGVALFFNENLYITTLDNLTFKIHKT